MGDDGICNNSTLGDLNNVGVCSDLCADPYIPSVPGGTEVSPIFSCVKRYLRSHVFHIYLNGFSGIFDCPFP